jgi:hypothetical protein
MSVEATIVLETAVIKLVGVLCNTGTYSNQIQASRCGTCGWADTDDTTMLHLCEIPVNEESYYEAQFSVSCCIAIRVW